MKTSILFSLLLLFKTTQAQYIYKVQNENPIGIKYYSGGGIIERDLITYKNKLYFIENDSLSRGQIWVSDGHETTTKVIVSIPSLTPEYLTVFGNYIYFKGWRLGAGFVLYRMNENGLDTTFNPTLTLGDYCPIFVKNNLLILRNSTSTNSYLTTFDGTTFTHIDSSIYYTISKYMTVGNNLFYLKGNSLYSYNFSTRAVDSLCKANGYYTVDTIQNIFLFSVYDSIIGQEIWRSDGTRNGTYLLRDIYVGNDHHVIGTGQQIPGDGMLNNLYGNLSSNLKFKMGVHANNKFYFLANDSNKIYLFQTDGTPNGTIQKKKFPFSRYCFFPHYADDQRLNLSVLNNKIVIPLSSNGNYYDLISDSLHITGMKDTCSVSNPDSTFTVYSAQIRIENFQWWGNRLFAFGDSSIYEIDSNIHYKVLSSNFHFDFSKGGCNISTVYNGELYFFANYENKSVVLMKISDNPLLINDIVTEQISSIYPNPFLNKIKIDISNKSYLTDLKVNFYNLLGTKVYSQILQNEQVEIKTANWENGIYLYELEFKGDKIKSGKIIKE